jgi:hypothetical protein
MEDLPFSPDCRYIVPNILAVSTLEPLLKKGKSGSFPRRLPHVFFIWLVQVDLDRLISLAPGNIDGSVKDGTS